MDSLLKICLNQIIINYKNYRIELYKIPFDLKFYINYQKFKIDFPFRFYSWLNLNNRLGKLKIKSESLSKLNNKKIKKTKYVLTENINRYLNLYKFCQPIPLYFKINFSYHNGRYYSLNPDIGRVYNIDYFFVCNLDKLNYQIICLNEYYSCDKNNSIIKNTVYKLDADSGNLNKHKIDLNYIYKWIYAINKNPYIENKIKW